MTMDKSDSKLLAMEWTNGRIIYIVTSRRVLQGHTTRIIPACESRYASFLVHLLRDDDGLILTFRSNTEREISTASWSDGTVFYVA